MCMHSSVKLCAVHTEWNYCTSCVFCICVHLYTEYFVHVVYGCVLTLLVVHMLTLAGSVHEFHVPGSP